MAFDIINTDIQGVVIIQPKVFGDNRGYFSETWNRRDMESAGFSIDFVQDNQSMSIRGVLRGLHFQISHPQTKLVRVIRGEVYDVAVDLRPGSPTYGKYHGELLSAQNRKQFLIPRGFAHGFLVLSDEAEFCYKCDDFYHPGDEGGIAWNDPAIGIQWPGVEGVYRGSADPEGYYLKGTGMTDSDLSQPGLSPRYPLILSEKDKKWGTLENL